MEDRERSGTEGRPYLGAVKRHRHQKQFDKASRRIRQASKNHLPSIRNNLSRILFPAIVLIGIATSIRNIRIRCEYYYSAFILFLLMYSPVILNFS